MTTFTTEDKEWAFWHTYDTPKYTRQTEIEFFFPLTEQIPLGLDYTGCEKPKISVRLGLTTTISNTTWSTNISPTLSVKSQNSVGQLNIGGIQIGMEKQPTWYQKVVFKLLGFNWKDK